MINLIKGFFKKEPKPECNHDWEDYFYQGYIKNCYFEICPKCNATREKK